jgi:CDP-diacylglycerol--serine O-phosphatidyltransferase
MTWRQAVPTSITLMAMLSGFLSILVTIEGMREGVHNPGAYYSLGALLIMLAMILDGLDGNLARWLRGSSDFGAELDTYVDLTAFGIAPAILVFAVTLQHKDPIWRVLLPSAVALSGVVRLARFKVKDPLRGQGGYAGLPITANAAWVSLFVFITLTPPRDQFSLNQGPVAVLFLVGIITFISLQVTNLHYPKPTKNAALFALCCVLVLLMFLLHQKLAAKLATAMIVMGVGYVLIGPLFVKGMAAHKARRKARHGK